MQRIERENLPQKTVEQLERLQADLDGRLKGEEFNPGAHWNAHRKSRPIVEAVTALRRMAGPRERCMYCVDSQGTDIEHFWPKSSYPNRMYVWPNLLIACAPCGRFKGTQFPLTDEGTPMLIDPSTEDPWSFLDYDPDTGNLNARYLLPEKGYSVKGETTVRVLHLDKREAVAASYRKTYSRLCRLVTEWVEQGLADDYIDQLGKADDHGLLGWFFKGAGQDEPKFRRFRNLYPNAWETCRQSLT